MATGMHGRSWWSGWMLCGWSLPIPICKPCLFLSKRKLCDALGRKKSVLLKSANAETPKPRKKLRSTCTRGHESLVCSSPAQRLSRGSLQALQTQSDLSRGKRQGFQKMQDFNHSWTQRSLPPTPSVMSKCEHGSPITSAPPKPSSHDPSLVA